MKRQLCIIFFSIQYFISTGLLAQSINYSASQIPEELKENAHAVVRYHKVTVESKGPQKASCREHLVITILDKAGDKFASYHKVYDKFSPLKSFKGNYYNQYGKRIDRLKSEDIIDQSMIGGFSLYEDNRIKYARTTSTNYPYTIEYICEQDFKGYLAFPIWMPIGHENLSVEQSYYQLTAPSTQAIKHQNLNGAPKPVISHSKGEASYLWAVRSLSAIEEEPFAPATLMNQPLALIYPETFYYDGTRGSWADWQAYGLWVSGLLNERDQLPEATVKKVQQLTDNTTDSVEMVKRIYQYMQNQTRYVSIQVGIGGWQPFEAKVVDEVGYGDCKALSNYTKALLKAAGIRSYYAIIGAGEDISRLPIEPDNPSPYCANHVILVVPLQNDTIWLECTSQQTPFGYLGTFTNDRNALIIKENGAEIWPTTSYSQTKNTRFATTQLTIDELGNATLKSQINYSGLRYDEIYWLMKQSKEDREKALYKRLNIPGANINKFEYEDRPVRKPSGTEKLDILIRNYAAITGKRMFLPLNILNVNKNHFKETDKRRSNIVIRNGFYDSDTLIFQLPEAYKIDYLPDDKTIKSKFGYYAMRTNINTDSTTLSYIRDFKLNTATYPPEEFKAFANFFNQIYTVDHKKAVLIRKDTE